MKIETFVFLAVLLFVCPLAVAQEEPPPPPASNLTVTKTGPAEASAGSDVTYTVTVTNIGEIDALGVEVTDPVPEGMTFVSASGTLGFTCGESEGLIACNGAVIAVNATATFTFTFNIDPQSPPGTVFTNVATATSETPEGNEEDNSGSAVTTIPLAYADIAVTKSGPGSAGPGTDVVYTITVTNNGPGGATNVTMEDTLPASMTFVALSQTGAPFSCSTPAVGASGPISCTAATLAAGASTQFQLTAHTPGDAEPGTELTNIASVKSDNDPLDENDEAGTTLAISSVDISIVKSGPTSALAGQNITYTIVVTNSGPDAATDVAFADTIPPNTTLVSLSYTSGAAASCADNSCMIPVLGNGQTSTFTVVLRAGDTTSITNIVTAGTSSFDTNPNNNSSSATTTITPQADVRVSKSGVASVTAGNNITWTVTVANDGPSTAANVTLTDTLPPGTTFVSVNQTTGPTFNCSPAGNVVTCTRATMAPLTSATFDITAAVAITTTGSITNTANVSTTTADPDPADNQATAIAAVGIPPADVTITKTANAPEAIVGSQITYSVVVRNNGPGPADNVVVTDVLPPGTTLVSAPGCTGTTTLTCNAGTLAAGAQVTFTIVVQLPLTPGTYTNTASVTTTTVDTSPENNATSAAVIASAVPAGIPTLSEWALMLMAVALAAIALRR